MTHTELKRRVWLQRFRTPRSVWVLIAVISAVELVLFAADRGLIGTVEWRTWAYRTGAFWKQLLEGAQPVFPLQPITMFGSYCFLHGGMLHLVVNMLALFSFGRAIVDRVGERRFLIAFAISTLGGSIGFALISSSYVPMVGASGALFGLLGLWICWDYLDRRHYSEPIWVTYRAIIYLLIYNLVFWLLLSGRLAWETHLGGFIAGWLLGLHWGRKVYRERHGDTPPSGNDSA